jgi:diaminopimelate decarboxylase
MDRLILFPDSTSIEGGSLTIGGCDLCNLAKKYGTPLYIYDRATMDNAVEAYKAELEQAYSGLSSITYAGKAFFCLAIAEWTQQQNLLMDCSGPSEIAIAVAAGVCRDHLIIHGVNKSAADIEASCDHAGIIVVDNLTELQKLIDISNKRSVPDLWLRFQPGLSVEAHSYTQTGQIGSKFGMDSTEILEAALLCRRHSLSLTGLHFHLGSQFRDPVPVIAGIERTLDLARIIGFNSDWNISPGGGWGVAYHEDELPFPDLHDYIRLVTGTIIRGCKERDLPLPGLFLEPGRSLVARAGVALYRVGVVKHSGNRLWALLDGGLADNPRHALYGTRYSALPVNAPERSFKEPVWFAGPFCESGDVLIEGLPFPEVQVGDLVAVPVSGAYQLSMASNYNGYCRPAVVWLEQGQAYIIQTRETVKDIFRRDQRLAKPTGTE